MSRKLSILLSLAIGLCCLGFYEEAFSALKRTMDPDVASSSTGSESEGGSSGEKESRERGEFPPRKAAMASHASEASASGVGGGAAGAGDGTASGMVSAGAADTIGEGRVSEADHERSSGGDTVAPLSDNRITTEFNESSKRRLSNLDFVVKKDSREFKAPFHLGLIEEARGGMGILQMVGLESKNVSTIAIHFLLITGEIRTINVPPFFLSGTCRGKELARVRSESAGTARLKINDKWFFCFDSEADEDKRLETLMTFLDKNIELYAPDILFPMEGRPPLRGEEGIYSVFNSILQDRSSLRARMRESPVMEKINRFKRDEKIIVLDKDTAYEFVRQQFAHAEMAAFEYFMNNYEALKKAAIESSWLSMGFDPVIGHVIDIVTHKDMCKNCFKTMFLKAREPNYIIRVVGLSEYRGFPRSRDIREESISMASMDDPDRLYIKNA